MPHSNLYLYNDEDKEEVRELLDTDESSLKRDIKILKEWLVKQPHLPQNIQDDDFFEAMLIRNKCRVEKAKACIDFHYTSRTVWPEMYQNIKHIVPSKHNVRLFVVKKLGKQKERIALCQVASPDGSIYKFQDYCDIMVAFSELQLKYDYSNGVRFIFDYENITVEIAAKVSPVTLSRVEQIFRKAYSCRIVSIHFTRATSYMAFLFKLVKSVVPQKIYEKIQIHDDLESLWTVIPRDGLPIEFGGKDQTISEMLAESDKAFMENHKLFEDLTTVKSNEELRIGKCSYDLDTYGTEGTFKKLNLD